MTSEISVVVIGDNLKTLQKGTWKAGLVNMLKSSQGVAPRTKGTESLTYSLDQRVRGAIVIDWSL